MALKRLTTAEMVQISTAWTTKGTARPQTLLRPQLDGKPYRADEVEGRRGNRRPRGAQRVRYASL